MKLSNQPVKGTADWFPEEFAIRKYIFDTWRSVCLKFGYKEYMSPLVEYADVYRAKSGEDIGGIELTTFDDRGGRELAIRPEMTPSITRMVSQVYQSTPKPLRLFSIANFYRNEKPQKGRNREFWQLNADIFGSDSINADVEILSLAIETMKAFGATKEEMVVYINDRSFAMQELQERIPSVDTTEVQLKALKVIDDSWKRERETSVKDFIEATGIDQATAESTIDFYKNEAFVLNDGIVKSESRIGKVIEKLVSLGYGEFIQFNRSMARGIAYYDGMVFEVFDRRDYQQKTKQIDSNDSYRSLFGGGRYNGLASIFGTESFPAVGFAPGDETTRLFLEEWNLLPKESLADPIYYVPLLSEELSSAAMELAKRLRAEGKSVISGLDVQNLSKALDYANKAKANFVVILGDDEKSRGEYTVKNMESGEQESYKL